MPLWLATNAQPIFEQMLLRTSNKIDGAIAANDSIAGAVIAALKAKKLKPIPLSGQDATVQGVQNIISGWQTMTVYKYVPRGQAAAAAAVALLKHKKVPGVNGFRKNGSKKEPTVQTADRLDHEGQLHETLQGQVPEEERRLRRRVRAVLLSRPTRQH